MAQMLLSSKKTLIILTLFLIIELAIGQTTQKPKKKKAKKRPASTKDRNYCLTCLVDLKLKVFDERDPCLNPLYNVTESELRYFNMCPETARHCQVEVTTVNKVFAVLERRCASSCQSGCARDGYGAENEACIYCCPPFKGPEYFDEESILECPKYNSSINRFRTSELLFILIVIVLSTKRWLIND